MKFQHYVKQRLWEEIPWPERYLHLAVENLQNKIHQGLITNGKVSIDVSNYHGWVIAEVIYYMGDVEELDINLSETIMIVTVKTDT